MKGMISEKQTLSDERLDVLLACMSQDSGGEEEALQPPVINLYRLEREKERRRSDRQLKITAAAASISVLLTTIITAILLNTLSAHSRQILQIPAVSKAYWHFRWFLLIYGRETGAAAMTIFALIVLGYLFCAVLLVKNRDKILKLRKN